MRQVLRAAAFTLTAVMAWGAPAPEWVTSWATPQQPVEAANMLAPADMTDATLRQMVRLSIGGSAFRLMLSNLYGNEPLHLKSVHVARWRGGDAIAPESDRALTFGGTADVTIPPGAAYVSDPVPVEVAPLADLAISIRTDTPPAGQTGHPGSRMTSYLLAGNHVADARLPGAKPVDRWYQIAAVEVLAAPAKMSAAKPAAVVVLGDSITDGRGSTTNGNDRWTNILAAQLQASPATRHLAVLNAGIGGNCILRTCLGPSALSRFERDVLVPSGASALIVLEGVNDLGGLTVDRPASPQAHLALVSQLIGAYQQMAIRAHARGLKAYIATILPYAGNTYYHPDGANEADRVAINLWIRRQKLFDGIIDFDAVLSDPVQPDHLHPSYDTGDFLHPNAAGYRRMGEVAARVLAGNPPKAVTPKGWHKPAAHRPKRGKKK